MKYNNELYQPLEISPSRIIPIRKIPKTTSGKIKHFQLRQEYLDGHFDETLAHLNKLRESQETDFTSIVDKIQLVVKGVLGRSIGDQESFIHAGMSSLTATQVAYRFTGDVQG